MDYAKLFKEKNIADNPQYPHNDIGIARLFYDLHSTAICYVIEAKTWYTYTGRVWKKDDGELFIMERCKDFVQALAAYAESLDDGGEESKVFIKYTADLQTRRRRDGLLRDARSIAPKSLAVFDRDWLLLNCQNGTFDLRNMVLRPHRAEDYLTKIARTNYVKGSSCKRWEKFISEIMCGDAGTACFLQKAFGYAISGDTSLECFFVLYGNTTRNGKSTLSETVAYALGDYARTIQPQTLARRSCDGAAVSPDIARLKGARLVNMPEPEKGLELNTALVKQLTGGDTYTGRYLRENPVEFVPEFKIFINSNHLPNTSDDTIFSSGRVKMIPFDRHFKPEEQDSGLKKFFRRRENMSGILNWLIEGYRLMKSEGLAVPKRIQAAVEEYRKDTDVFGTFLEEVTFEKSGHRLATSELYIYYDMWAKENGYRPLNNRGFVGELRHRCDVRRDGAVGNVVVGIEPYHNLLDPPEGFCKKSNNQE